MEIKIERKNDVFLIIPKGELDHHTAPKLLAEAEKTIKKKNAQKIVFDLSGLDFMDSSGIGVIVGRYKMLEPMGGSVGVVTGSGNIIKRIIKMSGIEKIVNVYEKIDEAVSDMGGKHYEN